MKTKRIPFIAGVIILLVAIIAVGFYIFKLQARSVVEVGSSVTLHIHEIMQVKGTTTYIRLAGFDCLWCETSTCNVTNFETSDDGKHFKPLDQNTFPYRIQNEDMDCKTFVKFILERNTSSNTP